MSEVRLLSGVPNFKGNMVDHNNFHENLIRIQVGELKVANLINSVFADVMVTDILNDDCKYDIKAEVNGKSVTFEVKEDIRCADTGNVVVEYESRGKPSGIETTEADFWIFRIHHGYKESDIHHFLIGTERLKRLIREKKYSRKYQMPHTDSKNKVYFFKYHDLIPTCYQID